LLLPALVGCGNAALDVKIAQLGDDEPGIEPGPLHRSGQPCTWCHGPYKGASPEMVVAGTVMGSLTDGKPIPVAGVKIIITDSLGSVNGVRPPGGPTEKTTNCAGNFYFTREEIQQTLGFETLAFPLGVKIICPNPSDPAAEGATLSMNTRISREGSCNGCHQGRQDQQSPGWVNCASSLYPAPNAMTCPGGVPEGSP
jgi:hypothetical protein